MLDYQCVGGIAESSSPYPGDWRPRLMGIRLRNKSQNLRFWSLAASKDPTTSTKAILNPCWLLAKRLGLRIFDGLLFDSGRPDDDHGQLHDIAHFAANLTKG